MVRCDDCNTSDEFAPQEAEPGSPYCSDHQAARLILRDMDAVVMVECPDSATGRHVEGFLGFCRFCGIDMGDPTDSLPNEGFYDDDDTEYDFDFIDGFIGTFD